ncbi:dynein regulatory complex protein 9 isoform X1 [Siniperca chuatsi]|uniref:dynein regulatory complex protein 9 isoform X1 n=1 Tax=Siniperca chuatsi TaxID=119488 RepID=UPI001CE0ED36|nr:dynein regulatory complex protein 9 isoform X1 [Siniperca chuatsi]XP_044064009.1 dynein regulatory complex protein 9 isoform X1 [Siniperca chuatsi]
MSLSRIQSLRLAAALEDCSDQLDILGHTLTVQISRERDTAAAQEKARLTKLRRDCQYISQQVFKLHLELEEKQSFSSLQQAVEEAGQKKKAENMRREAKRELAQRRQTVQRQQEEHQRKTEKLKDMYWLAKGLKHQLNEESSKIATKKKIVEKNTKLQLQQKQKETSQTEKLLDDQLELLQKQLKEETRVHEKSKTFLQNQHKELQQQLQQWQQRTKQMLQEKEQQLNSVRCKRTVNLDRLVEMRRKFKEMEQVVMEDREEQEKLCQQQAEARAATKLQAWWRGCMVRRGLGSFKKAEVVKKGKKKKEGKKKKKK